jgi:hypothetical protein
MATIDGRLLPALFARALIGRLVPIRRQRNVSESATRTGS